MSSPSPPNVNELLLDWSKGDKAALDKLIPLVYEELHRLAHHYMGGKRTGHTLQTSVLINEAYLRPIDYRHMHWQNRTHFFAVSAQLMRRILGDYAQSRHYAKRGGGASTMLFDEAMIMSPETSPSWWRLVMRSKSWRPSIRGRVGLSNCAILAD